jgi:hypothetical protein
MKQITEEEFTDRTLALQRARKIFMESGLTNNITHAFQAYQAIFAEREREIFLTTQVYGNHPRTIMDSRERISCPQCGMPMMFRPVPPNAEGVNSQLVCSNDNCDLVLDSELTIAEWMKELKRI